MIVVAIPAKWADTVAGALRKHGGLDGGLHPELEQLAAELGTLATAHARQFAGQSDTPAPTLTVVEASECLGITERSVADLCARRVLAARKVRGRWAIDERAVDAYVPRWRR